jgi:hypothetical protein
MKFEYFVDSHYQANGEDQIDYLDKWGREGWEMVGVVKGKEPDETIFYFKRIVNE